MGVPPVRIQELTGEEARATKALIGRLSDLKVRGLGHCRAAQALQSEINRRTALNNQSSTLNQIALPNYDPDEPRDRYGKWTSGGNTTASAANRPSQTPEEQPTQAVLRPLTWREKLVSDLRMLEHKFLPGTRTGQLEPMRTAAGFAGIGKAFGTVGRVLSGGLADLGETITGNPTHENLSAAIHGEPMPMVAESRFLPTPLRIVERG